MSGSRAVILPRSTCVWAPQGGHGDRTRADSALFQHFLDQRCRARGPMACVNSRFLFLNAAAARQVSYDERDDLWNRARRAIEHDDRTGASAKGGPVRISRRTQALATCAPIVLGIQVVGAELRFTTGSTVEGGATARSASRPSLGWESLRDAELAVAQLVAEGLTNREVGARLFLSRHTVDFHLRQIYRKLAITSRVELTRLVLAQPSPLHPVTDGRS